MPTWLSDPSNGFYVVLIVLVVIAVMVWARNRTRSDLIRAGVAIALLVALFVFDQLFESPREGSVRTVAEIAAAINERNWDKFQGGLSDSFKYKQFDKKGITEKAQGAVAGFDLREANAWDFKVPDDMRPTGPGEFLLQFEGKVESGGKPFMAHFVGTFVEESGRWRLKTFTAYDYIQKRQTQDVPGL